MSDNKPIGFNLIKVSTEQFAIIGELPQKDDNINVSTTIRFGCSAIERIVGVFTKFTFSESSNSPFLLVEGGCHFQIATVDWDSLRSKETNSIILPKGFVTHLLFLCIGTTRGILHSRTENTPLNKYYLPLINVSKLADKDVVFSLNESSEEPGKMNQIII
jgi:hypothetical protein